MRTWLVITLMAFTNTLMNSHAQCVEPVNAHQSAALVSNVEMPQVEVPTLDVHTFAVKKDSSPSQHSNPTHSDCFCNHVHCCGMVIEDYGFSLLPDVSKNVYSPNSFSESISLDLPIKPPSA